MILCKCRTIHIKSKTDIVEFKAVFFAPFLDDFYDNLVLKFKIKITLGEDSTDLRIAADSIKCSTDYFPAMTI